MCSHLCEEDLRDVVTFCSAYRLLELTVNECISQIVIWREVSEQEDLSCWNNPVFVFFTLMCHLGEEGCLHSNPNIQLVELEGLIFFPPFIFLPISPPSLPLTSLQVYLTSAQSRLDRRDLVYTETRGRCFLLIVGMVRITLLLPARESIMEGGSQLGRVSWRGWLPAGESIMEGGSQLGRVSWRGRLPARES